MVSSKVFLVGTEGGLKPLSHFPFEKERQLDRYVEKYPALLAAALSRDETELRFMLVEAQAGIDDSDGGKASRWAADSLFLDQHGTLTIVEDKLSRNSDIRRKIVGQMIEYAANILTTMTSDGLQQRLEKTYIDAGDEAVTNLLDVSAEEGSEVIATFWTNVQRNLQAGAIRMVFVADHLPSELRRMIEFLNEYMNPMEILGVEIRRMHDDTDNSEMELLVTSTIGIMERKPPVIVRDSRQDPISQEQFVEDFEGIGDDSIEAKAARRVFDSLKECSNILEFQYYRTARASTMCRMYRRTDGLMLMSVIANHRRNRCVAQVSYQQAKWPSNVLASLEDLLGFKPTPHGGNIPEWSAKAGNTERLVEWVKTMATA